MASTADIRILLIDSQRLFLTGLSSLMASEPGLVVIGQANNRIEALDGARLMPDVILLELILENESGLDFLPDLLRIATEARIVVLTATLDFNLHLRAVRLGAVGVVPKTEPSSTLFKAIRKVHTGEVWLNRSIMAAVISDLFRESGLEKKPRPEAAKIASLTDRELEVIGLIGEGRKNKQIGERLFISEATVRHHLTSIFDKLGVADRLELMIYAYQHGLATLPNQNAMDRRSIELGETSHDT